MGWRRLLFIIGLSSFFLLGSCFLVLHIELISRYKYYSFDLPRLRTTINQLPGVRFVGIDDRSAPGEFSIPDVVVSVDGKGLLALNGLFIDSFTPNGSGVQIVAIGDCVRIDSRFFGERWRYPDMASALAHYDEFSALINSSHGCFRRDPAGPRTTWQP